MANGEQLSPELVVVKERRCSEPSSVDIRDYSACAASNSLSRNWQVNCVASGRCERPVYQSTTYHHTAGSVCEPGAEPGVHSLARSHSRNSLADSWTGSVRRAGRSLRRRLSRLATSSSSSARTGGSLTNVHCPADNSEAAERQRERNEALRRAVDDFCQPGRRFCKVAARSTVGKPVVRFAKTCRRDTLRSYRFVSRSLRSLSPTPRAACPVSSDQYDRAVSQRETTAPSGVSCSGGGSGQVAGGEDVSGSYETPSDYRSVCAESEPVCSPLQQPQERIPQRELTELPLPHASDLPCSNSSTLCKRDQVDCPGSIAESTPIKSSPIRPPLPSGQALARARTIERKRPTCRSRTTNRPQLRVKPVEREPYVSKLAQFRQQRQALSLKPARKKRPACHNFKDPGYSDTENRTIDIFGTATRPPRRKKVKLHACEDIWPVAVCPPCRPPPISTPWPIKPARHTIERSSRLSRKRPHTTSVSLLELNQDRFADEGDGSGTEQVDFQPATDPLSLEFSAVVQSVVELGRCLSHSLGMASSQEPAENNDFDSVSRPPRKLLSSRLQLFQESSPGVRDQARASAPEKPRRSRKSHSPEESGGKLPTGSDDAAVVDGGASLSPTGCDDRLGRKLDTTPPEQMEQIETICGTDSVATDGVQRGAPSAPPRRARFLASSGSEHSGLYQQTSLDANTETVDDEYMSVKSHCSRLNDEPAARCAACEDRLCTTCGDRLDSPSSKVSAQVSATNLDATSATITSLTAGRIKVTELEVDRLYIRDGNLQLVFSDSDNGNTGGNAGGSDSDDDGAGRPRNESRLMHSDTRSSGRNRSLTDTNGHTNGHNHGLSTNTNSFLYRPLHVSGHFLSDSTASSLDGGLVNCQKMTSASSSTSSVSGAVGSLRSSLRSVSSVCKESDADGSTSSTGRSSFYLETTPAPSFIHSKGKDSADGCTGVSNSEGYNEKSNKEHRSKTGARTPRRSIARLLSSFGKGSKKRSHRLSSNKCSETQQNASVDRIRRMPLSGSLEDSLGATSTHSSDCELYQTSPAYSGVVETARAVDVDSSGVGVRGDGEFVGDSMDDPGTEIDFCDSQTVSTNQIESKRQVSLSDLHRQETSPNSNEDALTGLQVAVDDQLKSEPGTNRDLHDHEASPASSEAAVVSRPASTIVTETNCTITDTITTPSVVSTNNGSENGDSSSYTGDKAFLVAREIMTSERVFLDVLRLLNVDFRAAVGDTLPAEYFSQLLGTLPQLEQISANLLDDLVERVEHWHRDRVIADVLVQKGPFLKLFSVYIENFECHCRLLEEYRQRFVGFRRAVDTFERSERCCKLSVVHYMLKPVQRIPQYRLLLEDYMRKLTYDSADYDNTRAALEIVTDVAQHINDKMKDVDKFRRLLQLQERLGNVQMVTPGQRVLKEGQLHKLCRKGPQPRYIVLLTDCLLLSRSESVTSSGVGPLQLDYLLSLVGMHVVVPNSTAHEWQNEFSVLTTSRSFSLIARTSEERDEWVETINKAIKEFVARRVTFQVHNGGGAKSTFSQSLDSGKDAAKLGDKAPVWVPDSRATMCHICTAEFTVTFRRHHCRACGKLVCAPCSTQRSPLPYLNNAPARVCDACFSVLNAGDDLNSSVSTSVRSSGSKKVRRVPKRLEVKADHADTVISGYLQQRIRKQWKRRWFALKQRVLYMYRAPHDVVAILSLPVLGYTVERMSGEKVRTYEGVDTSLVFQLTHPNQAPQIFHAENSAVADKWVTCLRSASVLS